MKNVLTDLTVLFLPPDQVIRNKNTQFNKKIKK